MRRTLQHFITLLKKKGLSLSLAESMTCGMAAYRLSNCRGVSDVLKGAIVCYTPELKKCLLRIPQATMDRYTCESMEVTGLLARHLYKMVNTDIAAAITGLASPGGSETEGKPVGTVFICIYYKGKLYKLRKVFRGTPLAIKKKACDALYEQILALV